MFLNIRIRMFVINNVVNSVINNVINIKDALYMQ